MASAEAAIGLGKTRPCLCRGLEQPGLSNRLKYRRNVFRCLSQGRYCLHDCTRMVIQRAELATLAQRMREAGFRNHARIVALFVQNHRLRGAGQKGDTIKAEELFVLLWGCAGGGDGITEAKIGHRVLKEVDKDMDKVSAKCTFCHEEDLLWR